MSCNKSERAYKGRNLIDFPETFVVIDIETTGFNVKWDSIIELAALKVVDGEITDEFQELVNPGFLIDSFVEQLTGITNEMLADAKTLENVFPKFLEFIGDDSLIVGHNVNFDINFIYDRRMRFEEKPVSNDYVDTMRISRRVLPELEHHRLCDLIEYYNVDTSTLHRALADCKSTYEVLKKLKLSVIEKYESVNNFIEAINKKRKQWHSGGHQIDLRTLTAFTDSFDESHPLYNKHCCFTGTLEKYTRTQAAQMVVNLGGLCDNGVNKKTNFLVLGNNDYCKSIKDGKSSKHKKAEDLILKGSDLMILSETEFYDMIEIVED